MNCFFGALNNKSFFETLYSQETLSIGPRIPDLNNSLPDTFSWLDRAPMSRVKSQDGCAASWAFSVVGAVESLIRRMSGTLSIVIFCPHWGRKIIICVAFFSKFCQFSTISINYLTILVTSSN